MENYIDKINFYDLAPQRYWNFPSGYKKNAKLETRNMIFSGDYVGARKMDGAFYKFLKDEDGNMKLLGRSKSVSGEYLNKIEWVPQLQDFFNALPNGTCLLGEIYFPNNEGSSNVTTIMGCLKDKALARQEKGDKLHYYIFDVLAIHNKSIYTESIDNRVKELKSLSEEDICSDVPKALDYIEFAQYYEGEKLWNHLQDILSSGGEGVVITKRDTCYQPGKRAAHQTLKIKREIQETIDCFFTGRTSPPTKEYTGKDLENWEFWQDTKTGIKIHRNKFFEYCNGENYVPITKPFFYGWAGSLEIGVVKENMIIPIGWLSGLTEEIKANPLRYKGNCIEITCMEILYDDNNKFSGLRHAKMVQFRPDLTVDHCTWEKIFGEN